MHRYEKINENLTGEKKLTRERIQFFILHHAPPEAYALGVCKYNWLVTLGSLNGCYTEVVYETYVDAMKENFPKVEILNRQKFTKLICKTFGHCTKQDSKKINGLKYYYYVGVGDGDE